MIRQVHNPVTGEVLIFHQTSREIEGESVLVETIMRPDGFDAAAHEHPDQTERTTTPSASLSHRRLAGSEKENSQT